MLEKYYKYKLEYKEYLILIKCGNFYECIDNDAFIINKLIGYKLKKLSNTFRIGFPINNINKVINILVNKNINYIVIDNEKIIEIKENNDNKYNEYYFDNKEIFYNSLRIDKIINHLNNNLLNKNLSNKLTTIEDIIYND